MTHVQPQTPQAKAQVFKLGSFHVQLLLAFVLGLFALTAFAQGTVNNFRLQPDSSGRYSSQIRQAPTYTNARVLAAGVAEAPAVPTGAKYVIFSNNCGVFYAKLNAAAAVPAADVTDGSGSELNPTAWYVEGGSTIGVISPNTCIVTLSFYN